jgi:hypothetical protein
MGAEHVSVLAATLRLATRDGGQLSGAHVLCGSYTILYNRTLVLYEPNETINGQSVVHQPLSPPLL